MPDQIIEPQPGDVADERGKFGPAAMPGEPDMIPVAGVDPAGGQGDSREAGDADIPAVHDEETDDFPVIDADNRSGSHVSDDDTSGRDPRSGRPDL